MNMHWMERWEHEQEKKEDYLAGRAHENTEELLQKELSVPRTTQHEPAERSVELALLRNEIGAAEQYVSVGFWNKALEILKKVIDDPRLTKDDQTHVEKLYREAREMTDAAATVHPDEVERFGHFNLPTNDVN